MYQYGKKGKPYSGPKKTKGYGSHRGKAGSEAGKRPGHAGQHGFKGPNDSGQGRVAK